MKATGEDVMLSNNGDDEEDMEKQSTKPTLLNNHVTNFDYHPRLSNGKCYIVPVFVVATTKTMIKPLLILPSIRYEGGNELCGGRQMTTMTTTIVVVVCHRCRLRRERIEKTK